MPQAPQFAGSRYTSVQYIAPRGSGQVIVGGGHMGPVLVPWTHLPSWQKVPWPQTRLQPPQLKASWSRSEQRMPPNGSEQNLNGSRHV